MPSQFLAGESSKSTRQNVATLVALGLLLCLWGSVLAFGGAEPASCAVVEFLVILLLVFALWAVRSPAPLPFPWKGSALLLAFALLQTVLLGPDHHQAENQILRLLCCLSVFSLTALVCEYSRARNCFLCGLLGLGLFEAFYGLAQYLTGWQQIFGFKKVFYTGQATGTFINPNHFAGLLEMILPLSLALSLYSLERIGHRAQSSARTRWSLSVGEGAAALAFFFFVTLLLYVAILFSRSRMGILSAGAAVIVLGFIWLRSSGQLTRAVLVVMCLLAGTSAVGFWIGFGPVVERFGNLETDLATRLSLWKDTLALISRHPLLGSGLGMFADAFTRFQTALLGRMVDHAHNDYLEITAEWGVIGAGLMVGFILFVVGRAAIASFRFSDPADRFIAMGSFASAVAILLHSLGDFNLQVPANALLFASILGLAQSASRKKAPKSENAS